MKKHHLLLLIITMTLASLVYFLLGIEAFNIITGMLFLTTICTFGFLVSEIVISRVGWLGDRRNEVRLSVVTTILLLFAMELFFRFGTDQYMTYAEKNGSTNYVSLYRQSKPTWFHTHAPNRTVEWSSPGFTHRRTTNALGLSEVQIDSSKAVNEYRLVALGDSYTEGVGTTYDSTWVKVAERHLAAALPHKIIRTINAGISGSDVFFEYILLKERLLGLDPDLVVLATNNSDVADVLVRGGFERFQPDGSLITRAPPPWEWAYAISYTFRAIIRDVFGYNHFLTRNRATDYKGAVSEIRAAIDSVATLAAEGGFDLLVVVHPVDWEVYHDQWAWEFGSLVAALERDPGTHVLNLLEYYRVTQIITPESAGDFFWPIDGHYNTKGYRAMGTAVADRIIELRLIDDGGVE